MTTANPIVRTLTCGCTDTADRVRHWCPICSDALGGYPDQKLHLRTPLCDAAPELLAALQATQEVIHLAFCGTHGPPAWEGRCAKECEQASAAIAKAIEEL